MEPGRIKKLALAIVFLVALDVLAFSLFHSRRAKRSTPLPDICVSVVVPVYNSQGYIENAISSLLNQTLKSMEFIFVDDRSPDNSSQIVERYAAVDDRFRLIRNERNMGAGLSRNAGIEAARGEYVGFLDPDDWVSPEFYEVLYASATETAAGPYDIAKGQLVRVKNGKLIPESNGWRKGAKGQEEKKKKKKVYEAFTWQHYTAIFRRSVLEAHPDARYGSVQFGEDAIFLAKVCYYSGNITFTNDAKYYYLMRSGSLSTRSQYALLRDVHQHLKEIDEFFQAAQDEDALRFSRSRARGILQRYLKKTSKPADDKEAAIYKAAKDYLDSISPPSAKKE